MPRPCESVYGDPHATPRADCPTCRLYLTNPRVRAVWDRPDRGKPARRVEDWPRPEPLRAHRFAPHDLGPPGGTYFNASLLRYGGRLLLAYRTGWGGSEIAVAELGDDYGVRSVVRLRLRHRAAAVGREDPRLFVHKGGLHVSFVGYTGAVTNQLFARLSDGLTVEDVFHPAYAGRRAWEKNHAYFDLDGDLYAVYSVSPHRVLRVSSNHAESAAETPYPARWTGGHLRGGAPPVRVGGEFVCWFHGAADGRHRRRYSVGVYAFEARPPFRVTRATPAPVLWADPATCPPGVWADVVFPGGAVLEGGVWKVGMGVHDRWVEVVEWDAAAVDRALWPA